MRRLTHADLAGRLAEHRVVNGPGECYGWTGKTNKKGYAQMGAWLGHRAAWMLAFGDPGPGCVLHACDNPPCTNEDHLFLGTKVINNADRDAKGRQRNQNRGKDRCVRGHPLSGANVYVRPNGWRTCRACAAAYQRSRYQRSRA